MEDKYLFHLKNEKGQSVLEYVLLMAVVVSMGMAVFKSKVFTDFMGPNSVYFETLRKNFEFSYRYGSPPSGLEDPSEGNAYASRHESYFNGSINETRFFTPVETYP